MMWLFRPCVQVDLVLEAVELDDLTETIERGRPGGRFWALEQAEKQASPDLLEVLKDTGPMKPSEFKSVPDRHRSKVQRPKPAVKPWIGLIPKVFHEPVTLSDFIQESWTLVTRKN